MASLEREIRVPRAFRKSDLSSIGVVWPIMVLIVGFWFPIAVWIIKYGSIKQPLGLIRSDYFLHALWVTCAIAAATTVASVVLAYPLALIWWLSSQRISSLLAAVIFLPLIVGLLARNYSWIGMLSGRDLTSSMGLVLIRGQDYLYRIHSVIGVMTYIFVPIAFFILIYALSSVSRDELDAARAMGATDYEIVRRLVLPRTFRQAIIGAFLISANALGYFVTPHMLGGGNFDMLGNLIWKNINHLGLFAESSLLSISLLIVLSPFYLLSFILIVRNRQRVLGR